jgi:hypothetical protein
LHHLAVEMFLKSGQQIMTNLVTGHSKTYKEAMGSFQSHILGYGKNHQGPFHKYKISNCVQKHKNESIYKNKAKFSFIKFKYCIMLAYEIVGKFQNNYLSYPNVRASKYFCLIHHLKRINSKPFWDCGNCLIFRKF